MCIRDRVKTKTTCITDDYVEVCGPDGVSQKIPCDNVIIAAGFRTNHQLEEELKELLEDHLLVIGDAVAPRKIYTAVHEGFHAARLI